MEKNLRSLSFVESKNLLENIQNRFNQMSTGHQKIAQYFLENDAEASYSTTTQIAKVLHLSESTVVRFAKELHYPGFPELRKELQETIKVRMSSEHRMLQTIKGSRNMGEFLEGVIEKDIALLRDTLKEISRDNFKRAVDAIWKAKRIFTMGLRSSQSLASHLCFRLGRLRLDARQILVTGGDSLGQQLALMQKGDLFVAIGFFDTPWETVAALEFARENGISTLGITHDLTSSVAQKADWVLIAKRGQRSTVNSLTAPISVINALAIALAKAQQKKAIKAMKYVDMILKSINK